ncbi:hypothetical protein [Actinoallomurus oryzae]|uniref:hypothetical protein n=1 Tax=Actinoallomurus oryzae TaxID=502180 RepID=UPI0031ECE8BC
MHLHWALPDALTRMTNDDSGTRIPAVPDRWLVTRTANGTVDGQWVVESDYLAPPGDAGGGVTVPVPEAVPYRLLGRTLPLAAWRPDAGGERLPELTAVGHGEPSFAAFYPNCHSVFGFHDGEFTAAPPSGVAYDLVGWYSDPAKDVLAQITGDDWRARLDALGWSAPEGAARPTRTVCCARLEFVPVAQTANPVLLAAAGGKSDAGVYVGSTPTEALAAHLGAVLHDGTVEDLLEAIAFADELEAGPLDVGAKLAEAREAATFRPLPAGQLWTLRRDDAADATPEQQQARSALSPTHELADLLDLLNTAQERYDQAERELLSLREQLFADWYKYLLCAYPYDTRRDTYPDPDEVRHYLERRMAGLADLTARTEDPATGIAAELAAAKSALDTALAAFNTATAGPAGATYVLDRVAGPGFYLPSEPVVLITGDLATPSDRYGHDGAGEPGGRLACQVLVVDDPDDPERLLGGVRPLGLGVVSWQHNPWHPVLMQWEVEFFPAAGGNNLDPGSHGYDGAYVTDNYDLAPGDVELRPRPGRDIPDKGANVYTGTVVLSSSARPVLSARVLRYLASWIVTPYNTATAVRVAPEEFQKAPDAVLDWYAANGSDDRLKKLITLYRHLAGDEGGSLSQVLGGFNDALLMRRLTRQLPIADPLGFPGYQRFAARVAAAVGQETRHAPHPLSDFNPIRAGALRLHRLRVVDNFGIPFSIDVAHPETTAQLAIPGRPGWVAMPPRLAQPAQLSFRWLDSDHDIRRTNDVPTTSPVCGWIAADDLDDGLALYDETGVSLGQLLALPDPREPGKARWRAAPGGEVDAVTGIANPYLRDLAGRLRDLGPDALGEFVARLDSDLATIEPADYADGALTVRPLAVVRAEVDLRLMGLPAVHQDWNVFRQDMRRSSRDTDDAALVRFPARVGTAAQLDDGLVVYWDEGGAPHWTTDHPVLEVAVGLPARRLTMLVDPRAPVHLTSGILPAKAIGIPPEQYRDTLAAIRPAYFVAPVLTDGDHLAVPVPDEPGQEWSWRAREPDPAGWTETPIEDPRPDAGLPNTPTLREGYLILRPTPERGRTP